MTGCSRMAAMFFSSPPQFGQCSRSTSKARLSNLAQLIRTGPEGVELVFDEMRQVGSGGRLRSARRRSRHAAAPDGRAWSVLGGDARSRSARNPAPGARCGCRSMDCASGSRCCDLGRPKPCTASQSLSGAPTCRCLLLGAYLLKTIPGRLRCKHDEASCPEAALEQRQELAGPCHQDSTAEHPLCATLQTVASVLASVSDGVGGQ